MTETKTTVPSQRTGYTEQTLTGRIKSLLFGGVSGLVFGLLLLSVFAAILAFTSIPDTVTDVFVYAAVALSAFAAGFSALRMIKADGLVNGLIAGAVFFLLHAAMGLCFGDDGLSKFLTFGAIELPLGALGGIISVNLKSKRTRKK